ncbi:MULTISPECIES: diguanylate cyclase [unclassified Marinobacter]|jgi:diguanylate cyclase (GGDEF)-like protein|uniref:sensor domain-containing diguanylate cyclase n=1 Tax=unclassified Marinobacter TaxID=83889 RepID=UPI000A502923|nr:MULTISPECIES: diguanylate cyclase [unclassified Marinobacter]|tara:strand:+ start:1577 stop:3373 length:1797 start_codon:yes stop_codon:yes gene_type:complete
MMRQLSCILLIFLSLACLASAPVQAAPVAFDWLEAPADELALEDVRALPPGDWQTSGSSEVFNRGFSDGSFWLKVEIPPEPANRVMEIGYPLLDEVSVYWVLNGELIQTHHTGDTLPFSSRPIHHRNFVFLVPSNTEPVTAFVRVKTLGSVQIPLEVIPSAEFLANEQLSYGWQTMFLGIIVAMALYNLFLFVIVRHSTYFWYVLTVVFTGLVQLNFNGVLFQWLWPNAPGINRYFTIPVICFALFSAIIFAIRFLNIRSYSLRSYRFLQWILAAISASFVFTLFGSYQTGIVLVSAIAAVVTPAVWFIGFLVWRKGQVLGGFYVLAWTPLLIGHLILAVSKLGIMPRSFLTEFMPQIGVALEVVLLSFALAYRINLERRKRHEAQEQALAIQQQANLTLEMRVQARTDELERANEQLKAISLTDGLTHVANRRRFDEKLNDEWRRAQRHGHPLSLLMLDIDHFKRVNDELGHLVGDDCLTAVAALCVAEVQRSGDLLARYGGEEFSILLPATPEEGAVRVAEKVRQAVARSPVYSGERVAPVSLTISVGVASLVPGPGVEPQELIRQADEALYAAKESGRNRVMVARDFRAASVPGA